MTWLAVGATFCALFVVGVTGLVLGFRAARVELRRAARHGTAIVESNRVFYVVDAIDEQVEAAVRETGAASSPREPERATLVRVRPRGNGGGLH